ncbi:DUF4468 domain-containing protein [Flavivirga eckloniae]|uniref:DUF4468 domain-containing protein n=1 Tax=Flavivirga eckloniae TaxID=1803846 RepID=A0A2K9PK90_9FLAO|nr:DUF4468 domain-containing protein [Flavivirga eckloniae]AUP77446.1 hypothetical protein C1H87_01405 [Flavivirga eckloniae]
MKKFVILLLLVCTAATFSQSKKNKKLIQEIVGLWKLDDNNNVTYTKIIEGINLSKDEIYTRALAYFTYNYGDGDSVVQVQDKEKGTIVAKGLYEKAHVGISLVTYIFDTWHVLRIDIKENRARILLSLTNYNYTVSGGSTPDVKNTIPISSNYPVTQKGHTKNQFAQAFYKSHKRAEATLLAIEKALKEGNTFNSEQDDW